MIQNGYVKIFRSITSWGWYQDSKVLHVWIHLLSQANYETKMFMGKTIERGKLATSINSICLATGLSQKSVRNCLEKLKKTGEIKVETTKKFSIITIENFCKYQSDEEKELYEGKQKGRQMANEGQSKGQPKGTQKGNNERIKEILKEKETHKEKESPTTRLPREAAFEHFWACYPKKVGKEAARKAFNRVKIPVERLIEALETQKKSTQWKTESGRFIPNPATWLNQGRWDDELPEPESKCEESEYEQW